MPNTLNLKASQRLSAALTYTACGLLVFATLFRPYALLLPVWLFLFVWFAEIASLSGSRLIRRLMIACAVGALIGAALTGLSLGLWLLILTVPIVAVCALNRSFYEFFWRQRGPLFALFVLPLHLSYFVYSGVAFACGAVRHLLWQRPDPAA